MLSDKQQSTLAILEAVIAYLDPIKNALEKARSCEYLNHADWQGLAVRITDRLN